VCVSECVSVFGFDCEWVFGCRCVKECVRVCVSVFRCVSE
jgi:hypothetical protein